MHQWLYQNDIRLTKNSGETHPAVVNVAMYPRQAIIRVTSK
jgi:hypothetical protein